jgi:hypothetical protein
MPVCQSTRRKASTGADHVISAMVEIRDPGDERKE